MTPSSEWQEELDKARELRDRATGRERIANLTVDVYYLGQLVKAAKEAERAIERLDALDAWADRAATYLGSCRLDGEIRDLLADHQTIKETA